MKYKIRKATTKDALKIRNVHVAAIRGLCSNDYNKKQIAVWSNRKVEAYRQAMQQGELMFVAAAGIKIVGFSALANSEVRAIYVHPKFVRRGVAGALLKSLEAVARKRKIRQLTLSSSVTAFEFYLVNGFKKIRKSKFVFRDGTRISCILMKKSVAKV